MKTDKNVCHVFGSTLSLVLRSFHFNPEFSSQVSRLCRTRDTINVESYVFACNSRTLSTCATRASCSVETEFGVQSMNGSRILTQINILLWKIEWKGCLHCMLFTVINTLYMYSTNTPKEVLLYVIRKTFMHANRYLIFSTMIQLFLLFIVHHQQLTQRVL